MHSGFDRPVDQVDSWFFPSRKQSHNLPLGVFSRFKFWPRWLFMSRVYVVTSINVYYCHKMCYRFITFGVNLVFVFNVFREQTSVDTRFENKPFVLCLNSFRRQPGPGRDVAFHRLFYAIIRMMRFVILDKTCIRPTQIHRSGVKPLTANTHAWHADNAVNRVQITRRLYFFFEFP